MLKLVNYNPHVMKIATAYGWLPGAKYTNLRDLKQFELVGFIDIDWKNYDFERHLKAVAATKPLLTVANDLTDIGNIDVLIEQADALMEHAGKVIIVPKDPRLSETMDYLIPNRFLLGYSVPTRYGGTIIPPERFTRPVHLLGGRPDIQRGLGERMSVASIDCNRFTLDAKFGYYFNGSKFVRHPIGGYETCIRESLENITRIWSDYPNHHSKAIFDTEVYT